jgi:hypothetical protein
MIKTWKLAALASIAALGLLALLPGGGARPDIASAAFDCSGATNNATLEITITDLDESDPITVAGSSVAISPDPTDAEDEDSELVVVDNGAGDAEDDIGVILVEDVCSGEAGDEFDLDLTLAGLSCDIVDDSISVDAPIDNADITAEFEVEDCTVLPTPTTTATVTGTPTVPAAVTLVATPTSVGCQGSSFVTVTVKTATGANVANGTNVTLATNLGTITPATAQTFGGSVLGVFTAPAGQSGTATITATAGGVNGTITIAVNCGNPTAVPTAVPTQGTGITPPDTGDGGISSDSGSGWNLLGYGFIAVAALLGASGVAWSRRSR